jgi:hypothetical protein
MKLRLSIWTMLIAGSLLSVPTFRAGQIPLKNEPLERETDQNLNMKRYVAAGDRAYVVGVQDGSLVPNIEYFPPFGGAMVMQAWSSYGIHWPLVELYLGIKPDAPAKSLSVVPDLPNSWSELSVDDLHVGSSQIAVSVRRAGIK